MRSRLHFRWDNPPHVTSPTWGPPPSCTQALSPIGLLGSKPYSKIKIWHQLFKRRMALSTGQISIQWINIRQTNCTIHWIEIYPLDNAILLLNNWNQKNSSEILTNNPTQLFHSLTTATEISKSIKFQSLMKALQK